MLGPLFLLRTGPDGACAELIAGHDKLARAVRDAMWFGDDEPPEDIQEMIAIAGDPSHEKWRDDGSEEAPAIFWNFEDGYLTVFQITRIDMDLVLAEETP